MMNYFRVNQLSAHVWFFFTAKAREYFINSFIYLLTFFAVVLWDFIGLAKTIFCLLAKYQAGVKGKIGNQNPNLKDTAEFVSTGKCPAQSHMHCFRLIDRNATWQHSEWGHPCIPSVSMYAIALVCPISAKHNGKEDRKNKNTVLQWGKDTWCTSLNPVSKAFTLWLLSSLWDLSQQNWGLCGF